MFGINKERLIKALWLLRGASCAYYNPKGGPPKYCDCKYIDVNSGKVGSRHSESGNGCCELHLVELLLSNMTDEEYNNLCKKAGIV